ncbi:hypothetical protein AAG570_007693 [Ranatra chinensis]|uniref:Helicase MOV-10 helical domain-containing protein n=1 Tax=Ranatra chinensis TaxID=642074 RepID=A0ABD0YG31_9HEMI
MASKRRNMFQKNRTQETTENGPNRFRLIVIFSGAFASVQTLKRWKTVSCHFNIEAEGNGSQKHYLALSMIWAVWTKLRGVLEFIGLLDAPEKEEEQQPTRQPLERVVMTGEITGLVDNVGTIDNAVRFQIELHRHNFIIGDVVSYGPPSWCRMMSPDGGEVDYPPPNFSPTYSSLRAVYLIWTGNYHPEEGEITSPSVVEWGHGITSVTSRGDWVELQLREDEVVGLHPLRSKIVTGKVTKFSNGQGLINGYIYFTTSNYAIGCLAAVNNDVLCLAIESEQGHCSWRALTINELKMSRPTVNKPAINYVEEKDGINVQCQQIVIVEHESLVQTKVMIEFSNDYSIKSFHLENNGGQEIVYTSEENVGAPGIVYNLEIKGVSELSNPRNNIIMPGVRQLKPYAFVPVILGQYAIPDDLKTKFTAIRHMSMNDQMIAMQRVVPCLEFELDFNNYKARLHSLLFLEELCLLEKIEMLSFDTLITKEFDHYVIELPCREESNLISQGDKVLAKKRWRGIEEINFEGGIWKVCNNQLHVRFHSDFDLLYDDAVQYKISMEVSRTTFRRKHQAIDVCHKHLESEILFPSRMVSKPPQVVITGPTHYYVIVLLAAPSNSAVDMLALKMLDLGLRKIKMVRLISYKYAVQGRLPVALSDVAAVPSFDKPDRAVIDEIGQATEPESLIPMGK